MAAATPVAKNFGVSSGSLPITWSIVSVSKKWGLITWNMYHHVICSEAACVNGRFGTVHPVHGKPRYVLVRKVQRLVYAYFHVPFSRALYDVSNSPRCWGSMAKASAAVMPKKEASKTPKSSFRKCALRGRIFFRVSFMKCQFDTGNTDCSHSSCIGAIVRGMVQSFFGKFRSC
jgi:hypothetical protein